MTKLLDPRRGSRLFGAILLFLLAFGAAAQAKAGSGTVYGNASAIPGGYADLDRLFLPEPTLSRIGSMDGPLSVEDFGLAALLASGVETSGIPAYLAKLTQLMEELAASLPSGQGEAEKAETALSFLHEKALRSYKTDATTITGILDRGAYNCVSSAVLYFMAMKKLGIEVAGVRTTDHAFCLVRLRGADGTPRAVDVETTNSKGFDPGTKKDFLDSFGRVTGYAYVPPHDYARRSTIGEKALISLILSNRSSILEARGAYREALALSASYAALMAGPADRAEGRNFLEDRVNNLAAEFGKRRDYDSMSALAEKAIAELGSDTRLEELLFAATYNRAAALGQAGDWDGALEAAAAMLARPAKGAVASGTKAVAEVAALAEASLGNLVVGRLFAKDYEGARRLVEGKYTLLETVGKSQSARSLLSRIADAELVDAASRLPFREALALAQGVFASGNIAKERWEEITVFIYGNEVGKIAKTRDWLAAAALAAEGAKLAKGDGSLARAAKGYERNFVAEAHNRFAALFNAKDYSGALAIVESALERMPAEAKLLEDRVLAQKASK